MKPEQQQIAIAEACGYSRQEPDSSWFDSPNDGQIHIEDLPDYINDINAMHEAESIKDFHHDQRWIENLVLVCMNESCLVFSKTNGWDWALVCARSNAAQRAEAFLRTVGRWEE